MTLPLRYVFFQSFFYIIDALFNQLTSFDQILVLSYLLVELSSFFVVSGQFIVLLPVLVIHALLVVVYKALSSSSFPELRGIFVFFTLTFFN